MKCASCQKSLLLLLSHEAGWWTRRQVERHLRSCKACHQFRQQYLELRRTLNAIQPAPDERVMQTVLQFARKKVIRQQSSARFLTDFSPQVLFRPAWVYGALSVLALLAFLVIIEPVWRRSTTEIAQKAALSSPSSLTVTPVTPDIPNDVEGRLDELAWWLDMTTVDVLSSDTQPNIAWEDTEQLAAELMKWEDAQI